MSFLQKMVAPVAALALAMLLFGAVATAAHAQVPPFTADGSGLKAGDKVESFDGTKSCGTATADANGNWILQIASNAPCNPAANDTLTFTLNGAPTSASETYKAGGAPKDVARGITLTVTGGVPTPVPTTGVPAPAKTGDAGLLTGRSTGIATLLALGAFALIAVGGARAATRRR